MKLRIGDKAPSFIGENQNQEKVKLIDFKDKKLILFFYPKDNTPGCTAESCDLSENYTKLRKKGFDILGVSADTVSSHKRFITKFGFPFDLLADTEKKIIKKYGAWGLKKFMGREFEGILRITFIINEDGVIDKIYDKVKTKNHTNQILESYE